MAWFSLPAKLKKGDPDFPSDLNGLAKSLGVGVRDIEKWRRQPRVYEQVATNMRMAAIYLLPDALEAQGDLAIEKKDTKAARFLAQIAGLLGDGNAKVEINNTNVSNSTLEIQAMPDSQVFSRAAEIWARVKKAVPVEVVADESN